MVLGNEMMLISGRLKHRASATLRRCWEGCAETQGRGRSWRELRHWGSALCGSHGFGAMGCLGETRIESVK
ncbi:hypothetical protein BJ508DRAFT_1807 [Ascobolus immersus RN42]|uniref:Uncharacterized protein n=1 Tax=Ascobolus immersus RN42 TaxID=1160509 RepID=A0A3N4J2C3_ASCIM|nr:hypothetical protein BJ508DRAFT_1807 [Ascobolus immersus RN42]